jgi:predicted transcriptional regulator
MTIRLPDDKYERLRHLARQRHMSVNKLIEELSTIAITEFDIETRFRARAARGLAKSGLDLLDKLDQSG